MVIFTATTLTPTLIVGQSEQYQILKMDNISLHNKCDMDSGSLTLPYGIRRQKLYQYSNYGHRCNSRRYLHG
jgi:hypothetical protein